MFLDKRKWAYCSSKYMQVDWFPGVAVQPDTEDLHYYLVCPGLEHSLDVSSVLLSHSSVPVT